VGRVGPEAAGLGAAVLARRGSHAHDRVVPQLLRRVRNDQVTPSTTCRSCGGDGLDLILDLGTTPLANSLPPAGSDQPEPRFPLELAFCRTCTLVQITETVPPEQLFREYLYFSSFSDTMLAHAREL